MSIKGAGNFNGGSVAMPEMVNPFTNLSNLLMNEQKQAADEAYKNEMLGMQKAEHQMKVDAQAKADAEVTGTKEAFKLLQVTPEMKASAAIHNNMPALQPSVDKMAFTNDEVMASTPVGSKQYMTDKVVTQQMIDDAKTRVDPIALASKQTAQMSLGEFGTNMSQREEYKPRELERLNAVAAKMGDNTPMSLFKRIEDQRLADREKQLADEKQYTKDMTDAGNDANKLLLAMSIRQENRDGTTIGHDESGNPIYSAGGGKTKKSYVDEFNQKQLDAANKIKQTASGDFDSTLTNRIGAKKDPLLKEDASKLLLQADKLFDNLVSNGYPPQVAYKFINNQLSTMPANTGGSFGFFQDPNSVKLSDKHMEVLASNKKIHDADTKSDYNAAVKADGGMIAKPAYKDIIPAPQKATNDFMAAATTVFDDKNIGAAVTARATAESGLNPHATFTETDGKISMGILQWNGSRVDDYNKWATANGKNKITTDGKTVNKASTVQEQLEFAKYESETSEESNWAKVKGATNAYDMGRALSLHVIRPGDSDNNATKTGRYTQLLLGQTPTPVPAQASQATSGGVSSSNIYQMLIGTEVARKEKARQDLALSRMSPDDRIRASVLGNVAGFANGVLPARTQAELASSTKSAPILEGMKQDTTLETELRQAIVDRNFENVDSLTGLLKSQGKTDSDLYELTKDLRYKEESKTGTAPAAPVLRVLPPKSVEQQKIDNSWSGQLTNKILDGGGGHMTWNNLGKVANQVGDHAASLVASASSGINNAASFFTQPAIDAYNASTGLDIRNPFAKYAALADNAQKGILAKNSAIPVEERENAKFVQDVLGPVAVSKLGSVPAAIAEKMPYASTIGSKVLGNVAEGAEYLASKVPVLGRAFKPATKPVLPAPAISMTDDAVIPIKTAAEETATTGAKQATSREAQIDSKVAERILKIEKLPRYEFLKNKETLDRIELRELDALEKLFTGK